MIAPKKVWAPPKRASFFVKNNKKLIPRSLISRVIGCNEKLPLNFCKKFFIISDNVKCMRSFCPLPYYILKRRKGQKFGRGKFSYL